MLAVNSDVVVQLRWILGHRRKLRRDVGKNALNLRARGGVAGCFHDREVAQLSPTDRAKGFRSAQLGRMEARNPCEFLDK